MIDYETVLRAFPIGSKVEYLGHYMSVPRRESNVFEICEIWYSPTMGTQIRIRQAHCCGVVSLNEIRHVLEEVILLRASSRPLLQGDSPMKYEAQLQMLTSLAVFLQDGVPFPSSSVLGMLDSNFCDVSPRPESYASFIDGAIRRGWIAMREHTTGFGLVGTGQLWMFMRQRWSELGSRFVTLRAEIAVLVESIVVKPADVLLDMDAFAPTLSSEERALAWEVLLAAAPGLAMQISSPRDPKDNPSSRIRLAQTMLDENLLMKMVDIARVSPPPQGLPLEVSA